MSTQRRSLAVMVNIMVEDTTTDPVMRVQVRIDREGRASGPATVMAQLAAHDLVVLRQVGPEDSDWFLCGELRKRYDPLLAALDKGWRYYDEEWEQV